MNIVEALKHSEYFDVRVTHGDRWMYWDDTLQAYVVREHAPYQRGSTIIITTCRYCLNNLKTLK